MKEEKPYIFKTIVTKRRLRLYNTNYGDARVCECGHPYYRHFDPYEQMRNVGCKYCGCFKFKEKVNNEV